MLKTEQRNPNSTHIDVMSTADMLAVMQQENYNAAKAVEKVCPQIAVAIDKINERMGTGGRLFYVGCGTSGRIGVLDATECPPTYGVSTDLVVGIMAGGNEALAKGIEDFEDDENAGVSSICENFVNLNDTVIGLSVAGGAAFVLGALKEAKRRGAYTVGITCNEGTPITELVEDLILPDTGAEVVTGSTRMKAGTAQKMILNMISTGVMIKQKYVYENLMIHLQPSNKKLRERMTRIVCTLTGCDETVARKTLEETDWEILKTLEIVKNI